MMLSSRFLLVACSLLLAGVLTLPLLSARIAQPLPRPSEPGMATPKPSPTPSGPDEDDEDATLPAEDEEAGNSRESDNAAEPSPDSPDPVRLRQEKTEKTEITEGLLVRLFPRLSLVECWPRPA